MIRRLLFLFVGCAAFWLLTALPARMLGAGDSAMVYAGTAMLLCFVPAALTLAWAMWGLTQDSHQQLLVVVGGGGARMFFVLIVGLLLSQYVPYYQERSSVFLLWVAAAYLYTLTLEIVLLLVGRSSVADRQGVESK